MNSIYLPEGRYVYRREVGQLALFLAALVGVPWISVPVVVGAGLWHNSAENWVLVPLSLLSGSVLAVLWPCLRFGTRLKDTLHVAADRIEIEGEGALPFSEMPASRKKHVLWFMPGGDVCLLRNDRRTFAMDLRFLRRADR